MLHLLIRAISIILLLAISPILLVIAFLIIIEDGYPVFFIQKRVGINNIHFNIYKYRTMKKDMPDIPTHLVVHDNHYTSIGPFLRKYSMDELPQLLNIAKGDMTFIGPRPSLYNQHDLIQLRTKFGIHKLIPGITGWAQVNGRDELSIQEKVRMEKYYLKNQSIMLDLKIIFLTIIKVLKSESVIG